MVEEEVGRYTHLKILINQQVTATHPTKLKHKYFPAPETGTYAVKTQVQIPNIQ